MKCSTKNEFLTFYLLSNILFLFIWTELGPSVVSSSLSSLAGTDCSSLDLAAILAAVAQLIDVDPALVTGECPNSGRRRRELFYLPQFRQNDNLLIHIVGVDYATLQAIYAILNSETFLADLNDAIPGDANDIGSVSSPIVDNSNPSGILILQLF